MHQNQLTVAWPACRSLNLGGAPDQRQLPHHMCPTAYQQCPMVPLPVQVSYHCKHGYAYGPPDPVDILPASCSGLCLAAVSTLAFVVLSFLTPKPPTTPIVKKGTDQLVRPNQCGYVFAYGGLQYVPAPADSGDAPKPARRNQVGDGLSTTVSAAINSAGFIKDCWATIKAAFGRPSG